MKESAIKIVIELGFDEKITVSIAAPPIANPSADPDVRKAVIALLKGVAKDLQDK
jgi:hypothetical protein